MMQRTELCAECGEPLDPAAAYALEGDKGWEYVCSDCRWEAIAWPCATTTEKDPAQITAEEEAYMSGDAARDEWLALHKKGLDDAYL